MLVLIHAELPKSQLSLAACAWTRGVNVLRAGMDYLGMDPVGLFCVLCLLHAELLSFLRGAMGTTTRR